jgi:hypothetical protein
MEIIISKQTPLLEKKYGIPKLRVLNYSKSQMELIKPSFL